MLRLRSATEADIAAIFSISGSAYWSNFNRLEPDAWKHPGYRELVGETHLREAREFWPDIVIAEFNGAPGGWGARFAGSNEIAEMWIHADFQGKGAGSALIRKFLSDIAEEGHSEAWIETHQRNDGAIRLYERMGFVRDHDATRFSAGLGRDIPVLRLRRWPM